MPRFSDSVVKSKNYPFELYVNLHAIRDPMLHLPERGGGSENGPRLSLGNGTTFAPKVTCFTVYVSAESHRLRATAPYVAKSSRVLSILGGRGLGTPICTVKHDTYAIRRPASSIVLAGPKAELSDLT